MQATIIAVLEKGQNNINQEHPPRTHREITMVENDLSYQRISRGYENETVMSAALRAMTLDNTLSLKGRYLIMSSLRRLLSRLSEVISASRTRRNIYISVI